MALAGSPPAVGGYPVPSQHNLLPFEHERIPVMTSLADFKKFQEDYPDFRFGLYVAEKDEEGWRNSTSPDFMNKALPGFLYVPINIAGADSPGLMELLAEAQRDPSVIAVNLTQPHKSRPEVLSFFNLSPEDNVDNAVKYDGNLVPFDNNGPAFAQWYGTEVNPVSGIEGADLYLVGAGAAGTAILRSIDSCGRPRRITIIDPRDRNGLADELRRRGIPTTYLSPDRIGEIEMQGDATVINAAGASGAKTCSPIVSKPRSEGGHNDVVIDLRTHINDGDELRMSASTSRARFIDGKPFSTWSNYTLVGAIAGSMGVHPPEFGHFSSLVRLANHSH